MTQTEEKSLIKAARYGDGAAFERIVREYESRVYAFAYRMLGNREDALDASQEIFIKVYRGLPSFRGDSKFSVWLYRLADNVCLDMLRRRRDTVSLDAQTEDGASWEPASGEPTPQERLESRERSRALRRAVDSLPEEFKSVILLREAAGRSYAEIAGISGLDLGTVKSRIFRARSKLRAILKADGNFFASDASEKAEGGASDE